jgi:hypothetical protein
LLYQCPCDRHALLLTAGKLTWFAVKIFGYLDNPSNFLNLRFDQVFELDMRLLRLLPQLF